MSERQSSPQRAQPEAQHNPSVFDVRRVAMPSKESQTAGLQLKTLMTGLVFGESPRWWHDGRLWLADWGTQEILAVDLKGNTEVIVRLQFPSFQPICFDW